MQHSQSNGFGFIGWKMLCPRKVVTKIGVLLNHMPCLYLAVAAYLFPRTGRSPQNAGAGTCPTCEIPMSRQQVFEVDCERRIRMAGEYPLNSTKMRPIKDPSSLDVLDAGRPWHVVQRHPHAADLGAAHLPIGQVLVPRDRLARAASLQDEVRVEEARARRSHQLRHRSRRGRVLFTRLKVARIFLSFMPLLKKPHFRADFRAT